VGGTAGAFAGGAGGGEIAREVGVGRSLVVSIIAPLFLLGGGEKSIVSIVCFINPELRGVSALKGHKPALANPSVICIPKNAP
jgi:hypothetical protein